MGTKVGVLVDTDDYKLPPAVEAAYQAFIDAAVAGGVTAAVAALPSIASAVGDAVAAKTTPQLLATANVLPGAGRNGITGWFHGSGFGAAETATATNNRTAIQAAIDAAAAAYTAGGPLQRVHLTGVYPVNVVPFYNVSGTRRGFAAIVMKNGVELTGPGGLRLVDGGFTSTDAAGSYGAMIRANSLSNAVIRDLTMDGNTAGQAMASTCSLMELSAVDSVAVISCRLRNANLNGVRIISTSTSTTVCTNIRMLDNSLDGASGIGLQCTNFRGLKILRNTVANTGDNNIDVYGENGTTTPSGTHFDIAENHCTNGMTGVFLETVAYGSAHDNIIDGCSSAGIWVNRINGAPQDLVVHHNTISACGTGISVLGDTQGVTLDANVVRGVTSRAFRFGSGSGSVSNVYCYNNSLNTASSSVPLVYFGGAQAANIWIRGTKTRGSSPLVDGPATLSNVKTDAVNS